MPSEPVASNHALEATRVGPLNADAMPFDQRR